MTLLHQKIEKFKEDLLGVLNNANNKSPDAIVIFIDISKSTRSSFIDKQVYYQIIATFFAFIVNFVKTKNNKYKIAKSIGDEVMLTRIDSDHEEHKVSIGQEECILKSEHSNINCSLKNAVNETIDDIFTLVKELENSHIAIDGKYGIHTKTAVSFCRDLIQGDELKSAIEYHMDASDNGSEELGKELNDSLIGNYDFWGASVNKAARIATIANKSQIIIDEDTFKLIHASDKADKFEVIRSGNGGFPFRVKDLKNPISTYQIKQVADINPNHIINNYEFSYFVGIKTKGSRHTKRYVEALKSTLLEIFPKPLLIDLYEVINFKETEPINGHEMLALDYILLILTSDYWELFDGLKELTFQMDNKFIDDKITYTHSLNLLTEREQDDVIKYRCVKGNDFYQTSEQNILESKLPDSAIISCFNTSRYEEANSINNVFRNGEDPSILFSSIISGEMTNLSIWDLGRKEKEATLRLSENEEDAARYYTRGIDELVNEIPENRSIWKKNKKQKLFRSIFHDRSFLEQVLYKPEYFPQINNCYQWLCKKR